MYASNFDNIVTLGVGLINFQQKISFQLDKSKKGERTPLHAYLVLVDHRSSSN